MKYTVAERTMIEDFNYHLASYRTLKIALVGYPQFAEPKLACKFTNDEKIAYAKAVNFSRYTSQVELMIKSKRIDAAEFIDATKDTLILPSSVNEAYLEYRIELFHDRIVR